MKKTWENGGREYDEDGFDERNICEIITSGEWRREIHQASQHNLGAPNVDWF